MDDEKTNEPSRTTSTADAAVELNTTSWSIYRWCRRFGAPHTRVGRIYLVDIDELRAWRSTHPHGNTGKTRA